MDRKLDELRTVKSVRLKTLSLVEGLTQAEADHVDPGKWSVGQLLDHLHKSDRLYRGEIEKLVRLKREGKPAVVTVSLAEMEFPVPIVPKVLLPLADIPVGIANYFIPNSLRELFLRNRLVKAEAPPVLRPEKGKPIEELILNLRRAIDEMDRLFEENSDIDFSRLRYYHPLFGYNDVYDILGLLVSHEQRHQTQLSALVDSLRRRKATSAR